MRNLLDPKVMMAIKDLSLAAKTTIDGLMNGINKSTVKGEGLEFSQYRSYQPGDDLRSLDWKMFARSDRYYIRESEIETNISVRFLVDASASMNHSDGTFTKIEYGRYLVASLAYLASLQGDAIGLYIFRESGIFAMPSKQDLQHLKRLFYQLEQIKPEGTFTKPIHFKEIFAGAHKRELLVFVTDLYQTEAEIFKLISTLNTLRHEVIVFHLLAQNEMELDYKGYHTFEDLESGQSVQIDQQRARAGYLQKLNAYLEETRIKMLDHKVYYRQISTSEPLDQVLRDFLKQRNKLKV